MRALRIAGIALAFYLVFSLSQQATIAREGQTLPGIEWAIAVLTVFFLLGAFVTERTQGPEMEFRKDGLWGLAVGGAAIVVSRLV